MNRRLRRMVTMMGQGGAGVPDWWEASGLIDPSVYVAVYQAIGSSVANFNASLVNLVNPGTFDLTEVGTPTGAWDAVDGWQNKRLSTGFVVTPTMGAMYRFSALADINSKGFGVTEASKEFSTVLNTTLVRAEWYYSTGAQFPAGSEYTSGTSAFNNRFAYKNGVQLGTQMAAFAADGTRNIFIGGCNNGGAGVWVNQNVQAACFWLGTLTEDQMLALHNSMTNLA